MGVGRDTLAFARKHIPESPGAIAMAATESSSSTAEVSEPDIERMLSYRLQRAAYVVSRAAMRQERASFAASNGEARAIIMLGQKGPTTLNRLSRAAGLDKSQMSRVIAALAGRDLVWRESGVPSGGSVQLALTEAGAQLYRQLISAAARRNRTYLAALTAEERGALDTALRKIEAIARELGAE